ncbi:hypothetical protein OCK74_20060 [Chitinophagaceae bacterium LB-8]|uniref:Uncharacterized protein n=1 Tax=Paraflavisolibacter caeni TaxID=2982496 RepID=A0A9X2XPI6_9BACT|nr:hypothetical protein [Paraflavisolibacter caeni]MCU7551428.1 hypothetical protein [Paraflavisolibacter caeni]
MRNIITALLLLFLSTKGQSQSNFVLMPSGAAFVPEHGFLPGKKFQFYPTIHKFNFSGQKVRVELLDGRAGLKMARTNCSSIELNNESEFNGQKGAEVVLQYFQKLLPEAGIAIDSTVGDTLKVELQALDSRLIGFGSIRAHGLCQMKIAFKNVIKYYCVDITDKDEHSPISSHAFVTRKTATRIITSAAIREVIEQFFMDLKSLNNS